MVFFLEDMRVSEDVYAFCMGDLSEGEVPGYLARVGGFGVVEVDYAVGWGLAGRHFGSMAFKLI